MNHNQMYINVCIYVFLCIQYQWCRQRGPFTCCSGPLAWLAAPGMLTLFLWMYFRNTSAFLLASVHAWNMEIRCLQCTNKHTSFRHVFLALIVTALHYSWQNTQLNSHFIAKHQGAFTPDLWSALWCACETNSHVLACLFLLVQGREKHCHSYLFNMYLSTKGYLQIPEKN